MLDQHCLGVLYSSDIKRIGCLQGPFMTSIGRQFRLVKASVHAKDEKIQLEILILQ